MSEIKVNSVVNATGDNDSGFDLSTNDKIGMKIANSEVVTVDTTGVVFNENSADRDFRVEGNGNTHLIHADAGVDRVGINSGATDLNAGNYAVLNVGGVVNNAGQQAIFCTGSKTDYAGTNTHLLQNVLGIGDSTSQASGTGGGLVFTGHYQSGEDQVHAGTIEATKRNSTEGNYGFNMIGRTREHGNGTMQTNFIFGYDRVELYTVNTHRFNIDGSGNLTASDTSIGSLSDERLKTNIQDHTYSLDTFKKFDVKSFDWKQPTEHGDRSSQKGLIAQEVEKVDPSFVYDYELADTSKDREYIPTSQVSKKFTDDMDGKEKTEVRDVKLAKASKLNQKDAMYISVIQQLMAKVETLEAKVTALESK